MWMESGHVLDQCQDLEFKSVANRTPAGGLVEVQVPGQSVHRGRIEELHIIIIIINLKHTFDIDALRRSPLDH